MGCHGKSLHQMVQPPILNSTTHTQKSKFPTWKWHLKKKIRIFVVQMPLILKKHFLEFIYGWNLKWNLYIGKFRYRKIKIKVMNLIQAYFLLMLLNWWLIEQYSSCLWRVALFTKTCCFHSMKKTVWWRFRYYTKEFETSKATNTHKEITIPFHKSPQMALYLWY